MFVQRHNFATNIQLRRQEIVWRIIRQNDRRQKLTTLLEKKAGAIIQHASIDTMLQAKILKRISTIVDMYNNDERLLYECKKTQEKISKFIESINLTVDDTIQLPVKPPIFADIPKTPIYYQSDDFQLELNYLNPVNLHKFERIYFDNRVLYNYYQGTSFANYVFQNIKHSFNVEHTQQLLGNNDWRARLALLIETLNFDEDSVVNLFYYDQINYKGVIYETDFIPKYPVRDLQPMINLKDENTTTNLTEQQKSLNRTDYQKQIEFHNNLDIKRFTNIPKEYLNVFAVFPFKTGHYVDHISGKVVFLDTVRVHKSSVAYAFENLCSSSDIESSIADIAQMVNFKDVISFTTYADNLRQQGLGLATLRFMIGNYLVLDTIEIRLPTLDQILDWISPQLCTDRPALILPPGVVCPSTTCNLSTTGAHIMDEINMYISLINDIAQSCSTKMGACMMCSAYYIPEVYLNGVHEKLQTDAHRYVFLTLLLQYYNITFYRRIRDRLTPKFGNEPADMSKYKQNARLCDYSAPRITTNYTVSLIKPVDISGDTHELTPLCTPTTCIELYEFSDIQLKNLVDFGEIIANSEELQMTTTQLAAFIALCLNVHVVCFVQRPDGQKTPAILTQ